MPPHVLQALLSRIGLALIAGILAAIVPIALRRARFEAHVGKRVFLYLLALTALIGFGVYGWYLVSRHLPEAEPAPEPIEYPATPPGP
jgi:hypothetical protein